jgi:hypothetical protein
MEVMKMKKILTLTLIILLAFFLLTACSGKDEAAENPTESVVSVPDDLENTFVIADYYNEDGTFSALGLALDEINSEKVLTVKSGEILVVGDLKYEVAAESVTLSFYTQSSLENVITWWIEHMQSWQENGDVVNVK